MTAPSTPDFAWTPPVDSGIRARFVEANGLSFEVAEAGPADADRLALCLHGFPELNVSWRHQMPLLAARGYRVWAPNLRGYGATTRPEGVEAYRVNTLIEDIGALIDAANAEASKPLEVTLIAHDWGAVIAWHFAIKRIRPLARQISGGAARVAIISDNDAYPSDHNVPIDDLDVVGRVVWVGRRVG